MQDEDALGEYVVYLTRQLADQPYNKQVIVSWQLLEMPGPDLLFYGGIAWTCEDCALVCVCVCVPWAGSMRAKRGLPSKEGLAMSSLVQSYHGGFWLSSWQMAHDIAFVRPSVQAEVSKLRKSAFAYCSWSTAF